LGGGNSDSITFHNRSSTKGRGIPSSLGSMGIPLSVESIFHFVRRSKKARNTALSSTVVRSQTFFGSRVVKVVPFWVGRRPNVPLLKYCVSVSDITLVFDRYDR
jgi:hypothetical protein